MKVTQSCPTLCGPMDYTAHGILQARVLEWAAFPFSGGSCQPRVEPRSPVLQADSLPADLPGKPKNTGVGSLSLLQQVFQTQESNRGLLHGRRIHQLSCLNLNTLAVTELYTLKWGDFMIRELCLNQAVILKEFPNKS